MNHNDLIDDSATAITSEQFKERLDRLCAVNGLLTRLLQEVEFAKLPKHLRHDAIKRMGLRIEVCPWTDQESYFVCGGEQIEVTGEQFRDTLQKKVAP